MASKNKVEKHTDSSLKFKPLLIHNVVDESYTLMKKSNTDNRILVFNLSQDMLFKFIENELNYIPTQDNYYSILYENCIIVTAPLAVGSVIEYLLERHFGYTKYTIFGYGNYPNSDCVTLGLTVSTKFIKSPDSICDICVNYYNSLNIGKIEDYIDTNIFNNSIDNLQINVLLLGDEEAFVPDTSSKIKIQYESDSFIRNYAKSLSLINTREYDEKGKSSVLYNVNGTLYNVALNDSYIGYSSVFMYQTEITKSSISGRGMKNNNDGTIFKYGNALDLSFDNHFSFRPTFNNVFNPNYAKICYSDVVLSCAYYDLLYKGDSAISNIRVDLKPLLLNTDRDNDPRFFLIGNGITKYRYVCGSTKDYFEDLEVQSRVLRLIDNSGMERSVLGIAIYNSLVKKYEYYISVYNDLITFDVFKEFCYDEYTEFDTYNMSTLDSFKLYIGSLVDLSNNKIRENATTRCVDKSPCTSVSPS